MRVMEVQACGYIAFPRAFAHLHDPFLQPSRTIVDTKSFESTADTPQPIFHLVKVAISVISKVLHNTDPQITQFSQHQGAEYQVLY